MREDWHFALRYNMKLIFLSLCVRSKVGGEGGNRGWDGWMASPTQRTWVWVNSGSWWWTGRPGVLQVMGLQRVGHDWRTELNWCVCLHLLWLIGWFTVCCSSCCLVTKPCLTLASPWTIACHVPLSVRFSRQEYWKCTAISSSRGSFWPRDWTCVSCTGRQIVNHCSTKEAPVVQIAKF